MNIIFFIMSTASICLMIYSSPESIMSAMIDGASGSITLAIKLFAVYAIWLSIIKIMEEAGLNEKLSRLFDPLVKRCFKGESKEAREYMSLNMSANMLGIGSIATPLGIKAVENMDKKDGIASDNVILFVIINCTSIQLLPTTVLGLRTAAGSINPSDIILPSLIATLVSSVIGVLLAILCGKVSRKIKKRTSAGINE